MGEIHPGEPAETPVVISGHDIVAAYGVRGNPSEVKEMANDKERSSLSGLTEDEAKEFHTLFITSFIGFTVICDHRACARVELAALAARRKGYALLDGAHNAMQGR